MAKNPIEGPGGTQATHSAANPDFGDMAHDLGAETRHTGVQDELGINGADYWRGRDIDDMRSDIEREIRAHPIKSIALALGAGYVIGRLFK